MARVTSQWLSRISGKLQTCGGLTFRTRNGQIIAGRDPSPGYTRSTAQDEQRTKFSYTITRWYAMTPAEREEQAAKTADPSLTTYQRFISAGLRGLIPSPAPVITDGLISYWSMTNHPDGNILDHLDTHPLVPHGSPPFEAGVLGPTDQSVDLDGSNQYLTDPGHLFNRQTMTIIAWIFLHSNSTYNAIVCTTNNSWYYGYSFRTKPDGSLEFYGHYDSGNYHAVATSTQTIPTNSWTMVALTFTAPGTATLYINGAEAGTGGIGNAWTYGGNTPHIGSRAAKADFFDGLIDEIYLYDRVLSADEISQTYDSYV